MTKSKIHPLKSINVSLKSWPLACFSLLSFFINFQTYSQVSIPEHADKIVRNFELLHYKAKKIDGDFAKMVFNKTIDLLDPKGNYFTQEDLELLKPKADLIPSDISNKKTEFVDDLEKLFSKKLTEVLKLIEIQRAKPIVFKNEALAIDRSNLYWSKKEFESKWDKVVKARILRTYFNESDSVEILNAPSAEEIEKLKIEVLNIEKQRIESFYTQNGDLKGFIGENYLKAIALSYDPHSDYFSVSEREEFNLDLSKEVVAFGFSLEINDANEFVISSMVPGSPAWKSSALNEDDVLLQAKSNGKIFKFENKSMDQVRDYLSDEKQMSTHFWVRKKNGEEIEVDLTKEALDVEQNLIESFILEGKDKIAYIYLPSFYSKGDDEFSFATGCANDVAKELMHLQKEGVSGLIFDLRSNGGGSMLEAILLSGIFVDYGALAIFDGHDSDPETLKDINKGVLFDKPMVVLVDQFSASASELFAAAMQDHHRALIVGSPTYGKSTAQAVYPIDAFESLFIDKEPEAYVKITNGAFYRVTGKTHQSEGIIPDIRLPNYYDFADIKESNEPGVLTLNPIEKKTYYYPLPEIPTKVLDDKSVERVSKNENFAKIKNENVAFALEMKKYTVPLNFDLYKADWLKDNAEEKTSTTKAFVARNPNYMEKKGSIDVHIGTKELNDFNLKNIHEDFYIEEAFFIINDLIQTQNK